MKDISELTQRIREVNHSRGWGTEFTLETPSNPITAIALISTEIGTELHEELQKGDLEKARIEIIDAMIRMLDLDALIAREHGEGLNLKLPETDISAAAQAPTEEELLSLHVILSEAVQTWRAAAQPVIALAPVLQEAFSLCAQLVAKLGGDVVKDITAKVDYNATRPWRHGQRRC